MAAMKWCILGRHGFIGSALEKKLLSLGHSVISNPTPDVDILVHLASPTHIEFEKNVPYHMGESIRSFELLLPFCKDNNIHFVFASSALVYEPKKESALRNCKVILEEMAEAYGGKTLSLRIFPVYGPQEHTTAISQWCKQMKEGKRPEVFGDGTQERDFIYIDDVVDNIIRLSEVRQEGIADVGAGKPISFNEIVQIINNELKTNLLPLYLGVPLGYSKGVTTKRPLPIKVDIHAGIRKVLLG